MPIGEDALAAGFTLVPDTGEDGRVVHAPREFNRTRDFIAAIKALIPVGKAAYRTASGISSGTAEPSGGANGDIYFKILS